MTLRGSRDDTMCLIFIVREHGRGLAKACIFMNICIVYAYTDSVTIHPTRPETRQGLLLTLVRPERAGALGPLRLLEEYIGGESSLLGRARQLAHGPVVHVGVVQLLGRVDDRTVEGGSHDVQQIKVLVARVTCAPGRRQGRGLLPLGRGGSLHGRGTARAGRRLRLPRAPAEMYEGRDAR